MGRELKRVSIGFIWPINKRWDGYVNPHYYHSHDCEACAGRGETFSRQRLHDLMSLLMLSGTDAAKESCHPYLQTSHLYATQGLVCGKDMVELTEALSGRKMCQYLGHGSSDTWRAVEKLIQASGLPETWGFCPVCKGEGSIWDSDESKKSAENWSREEPPAGDGFQIWETVSEGSPISPVFKTAEDLAGYMAGRPWGADKGSSYESWMKFITGPGWSLSMVVDASGVRTGADACA